MGHYLAWIQNFDPQAAFQMGSRDAEVCCDNSSYSICHSPGANPRLCHTITRPPLCFMFDVTQEVVALSPTLRSAQTFLFDRKISNFDSLVQRIYSTALLSSLYAPWPTGAFWHSFRKIGLLTTILPYMPDPQSLPLTVDVLKQSTFCLASWWLRCNCFLLLFLLLVYQS